MVRTLGSSANKRMYTYLPSIESAQLKSQGSLGTRRPSRQIGFEGLLDSFLFPKARETWLITGLLTKRANQGAVTWFHSVIFK